MEREIIKSVMFSLRAYMINHTIGVARLQMKGERYRTNGYYAKMQINTTTNARSRAWLVGYFSMKML